MPAARSPAPLPECREREKLHHLRGVFGDRLSLVATAMHDGDDESRLKRLAAISRDTRIPLVATNHVHYHHPDRRMLQDVVTCIRHGCTLAEAGHRLFPNGDKDFDVGVADAGGSVLLVSNFTVAARTQKGRRPSFDDAADAGTGLPLFESLVSLLSASGIPVQTGRFGAHMHVSLVNDGPVTVIVDSRSST